MKTKILMILAVVMTALMSCGTSQEEKIQLTNNAAELQVKMPANIESIRFIDSVFIPAVQKEFDPKIVFSTEKEKTFSNFSHWEGFEKMLYNDASKVGPTAGFWLKIYQTTKTTTDLEILSQTGGKILSESEFFQALYYLASSQPNGNSGKMLVKHYGNIFHVKNKHGVAVSAYPFWSSVSGAWLLCAYEFGGWNRGLLVFSRGN